ncbi:hypothetical protein PC9H_006909 [Pleurotus ostreatus]|uniref:Uncharacterized protein n=1 Tax=Pleurotus ostreatus TaxID=5322 RepID=A0A8H6ZXV1_PLEOS|nr:uncharacterized protein PC9H_006909 [Pleurotus ostreatus]KAF7431188.1 hypothetical protein PC9H_006909 [Pleurotus ostreatus]KAJ8695642.1 hypothetical protein PTI98_008221 [Pleurotus ostreatus]
MAAARISIATLAHRQHEFDTVESKEVLCAAANIHWKGAPTSLHDPVFGALGLMGRMRVLQYLGMFDLAEQFRAEEQDGVSDDDDDDNADARERVIESEDESNETGAGDRATLAEPHVVYDADDEEQEVEVVDNRFLPDEEEPESKDSDSDIAHEIPTDPANIPLPKSDDDDLLEEAGDNIDPVSATTESTKSESESDDTDADAESGESDSDESDSGDELFWSSPINGTLELEEEDALEQDARGADQDHESPTENDPSATTNPRKRARTPSPGDEEDEPPCKMARVDEEELLSRFDGNVLKLAIHNAIQRNMTSKLEANSYWHDILFD